MKIEVDGRRFATILISALCGAGIVFAVGYKPIAALQTERNMLDGKAYFQESQIEELQNQLVTAEARSERLNASARMFADNWVRALQATGQTGAVSGCIDQFDPSSCFHVSYSSGSVNRVPVALPSTAPNGPNPMLEAVVVAMYNRIHPGLGDAIKAMVEKQSSTGN